MSSSTTRGPTCAWVVLALLVLARAPTALQAAEQATEGLLVSIPPVITTESTNRLRNILLGPLNRFKDGASKQGGKFTVICNFNPENRNSACDDFGASYSLAKYLRSLQTEIKGVATVAYVPADVTRHSVLPVLACTEIVFGPEGRLGQVTADRVAGEVEQAAYREITRGRYPSILIRKMYDGSAEVLKLGDQYIDGDVKPRPVGEPVAEFMGNDPILYTFKLASKVGLCQRVAAETLDDVRVAYGLPRGSVGQVIDRSACWRIPVDGALDGETVELTQRRIRRALTAGANLLILELRCAGGQVDKAHELGMYLARLNEDRPDNPVETVAFVTNKARNLAIFPAIGCGRMVMQKEDGDEQVIEDIPANEARLGGLGYYLDRHPELESLRQKRDNLAVGDKRMPVIALKLIARSGEVRNEMISALKELAKRQNYPEAIMEGMCRPEVRIVAVERVTGAGGRLLLTEDDFRADQQGPKLYRQLMQVKPWMNDARFDNQYLTLNTDQARQLGLANTIVKDHADLYASEGVVPEQVHVPEAGWLDGLAEFLRNPWTSVILVMVGITCLVLEFKTPGVGLPGVIAAICFVLFFWAHSHLHGQITWLAVLLFVLGLALIALEVFVIPGFGICGISGIILLLASLGLVAYGHWPTNGQEWIAFGYKISPFGISMLGSLGLVFLLIKYLPYIPVLNRLISKTPQEEEGTQEPELPMQAEYRALLGAIGVAATPLRPAGKSQFGDAFVDVVADGGYIMPGTRVQVIEVEGNRVVVKEV